MRIALIVFLPLDWLKELLLERKVLIRLLPPRNQFVPMFALVGRTIVVILVVVTLTLKQLLKQVSQQLVKLKGLTAMEKEINPIFVVTIVVTLVLVFNMITYSNVFYFGKNLCLSLRSFLTDQINQLLNLLKRTIIIAINIKQDLIRILIMFISNLIFKWYCLALVEVLSL